MTGEERFFWWIWAAKERLWSLETRVVMRLDRIPRWDWRDPHRRWQTPKRLGPPSATDTSDTPISHTTLPASPTALYHIINFTLNTLPTMENNHIRNTNLFRKHKEHAYNNNKTNLQRKWTGQRRGHGFRRRGNEAFRRDNEEESCRRNCRGTWWFGWRWPCFARGWVEKVWGPVLDEKEGLWRRKLLVKILSGAPSSLGMVPFIPYL